MLPSDADTLEVASLRTQVREPGLENRKANNEGIGFCRGD